MGIGLALLVISCGKDAPPIGAPIGPTPLPPLPAPPTEQRSTGPIAFVSTRDGSHAIYLANEDGSTVTRLVATSVQSYPAWSPDRGRLAFVNQPAIYVVNVDGSGLRRIWSQVYTSGPVDWSPDGSKVAFMTCCGTDKGIFVMNSDGSEVTRLIEHESVGPGCDGNDGCGVESPTWSPDGQQIAFLSWGRITPTQLVAISVDGTRRRVLLDADVSSPAWSPDGTKIAFQRGYDLGEIGIVNADGSGRPLYLGMSGKDPRWVPDGSILFSAKNDAGRKRIFVASGAGSRRQLIPEASAPVNPGYEDCCAVWAR
jgi:Tol biopolymer transport system component